MLREYYSRAIRHYDYSADLINGCYVKLFTQQIVHWQLAMSAAADNSATENRQWYGSSFNHRVNHAIEPYPKPWFNHGTFLVRRGQIHLNRSYCLTT